MKYARTTHVGEDKSRSEIEKILVRYGATAFMYMNGGGKAAIVFEASGRRIKMVLPLPMITDFLKSPKGRNWSKSQASKAHAQSTKQRWRALALVIKAKLEAVETGVATFEQEFLAYTVLPNGSTVSESILPSIQDYYQTGSVKPLLLGMG
jgi:hypothetical protein